ncbi:hypothetical protein PC114_g4048 [Phytophthora cactorum]|nr:hypothetical protein PC114_g4048 [Phytophthora cactorum]
MQPQPELNKQEQELNQEHEQSEPRALRPITEMEEQKTGGPSSSLVEVLAHPLTWVFVLPFFAIGMYVSITQTATFLRRRREERRIESKQYLPVN